MRCVIGNQLFDSFAQKFDYFAIFCQYLAAKAIERPVCGLICQEKVNIFDCFGHAVSYFQNPSAALDLGSPRGRLCQRDGGQRGVGGRGARDDW